MNDAGQAILCDYSAQPVHFLNLTDLGQATSESLIEI